MRIVIAEDSVLLLDGLTRLLTDEGHEVVGYRTADELGMPSFVEIVLARVVWSCGIRSRYLTLIVHLLSWKWHDLVSDDAGQNPQRLPSLFGRQLRPDLVERNGSFRRWARGGTKRLPCPDMALLLEQRLSEFPNIRPAAIGDTKPVSVA